MTTKNNMDTESNIISDTVVKVKKPRKFKVILHNDDYTPMDFVIELLERIFNKDEEAATQIMLEVHNNGFAVCGIYPFGIAETKVVQVQELARSLQHPLQCTLEVS